MQRAVRFRRTPSGGARSQAALHQSGRGLDSVADGLLLPRNVRRRAASISADAAAMSLDRATGHPTLTAAALYMACREHRELVTLRELADATGTDQKDVSRCYAMIMEKMNIARPSLNGKNYVHRLALSRPLPDEAYRMSEEIVRTATEAGLGGRNPMTVAAAALYLACCAAGENVTQSEVAEAAGVGEERVRECCKVIRSIAKP